MSKPLSEMSLEELWELFPIILKAHNPDYLDWYRQEAEGLLAVFKAGEMIRISHIGSTAVAGLLAKPTVDILMEMKRGCDIAAIKESLSDTGWGLMKDSSSPDLGLAFCKGYTPEGFADRVFHLHVRLAGDWDELYFRDYLIDHPDVARLYAQMKESLLQDFKHNRDGYTGAKTEFVRHYTALARLDYPGRYQVTCST